MLQKAFCGAHQAAPVCQVLSQSDLECEECGLSNVKSKSLIYNATMWQLGSLIQNLMQTLSSWQEIIVNKNYTNKTR